MSEIEMIPTERVRFKNGPDSDAVAAHEKRMSAKRKKTKSGLTKQMFVQNSQMDLTNRLILSKFDKNNAESSDEEPGGKKTIT